MKTKVETLSAIMEEFIYEYEKIRGYEEEIKLATKIDEQILEYGLNEEITITIKKSEN